MYRTYKILKTLLIGVMLSLSAQSMAQGGCYAAGSNLSFPSSGGTQTSTIQGGCSDGSTFEFQIGTKPSWIISAFPNGTQSVTVTASENTQGTSRSGSVQLVKNGSQIGVISVSQDPGIVTVGQVTITSGPTQRCNDGDADYNATATNATSYAWSLSPASAGAINSNGNVSWNGSSFSTVTVQVTAYGPNNSSSTATRNVVFAGVSTPGLQTDKTQICTGEQATLTLGPLENNVSYVLLRNGSSTNQTANGSSQGGVQWTVTSGGEYSVEASQKGGLQCDFEFGFLTITELAGLGNPSLSNPGARCMGPGTSSLNVSGGSGANTYNWSLTNAGSSTINGSGASATVNWDPGFTGTATISVQATSECGTTTTLNRTITVTVPPIWYRDTDNDDYRDLNGESRQQCTEPTDGNWTLSTNDDLCPQQPAPGVGTNGCDPDCADGYIRESGSSTGAPPDEYTPTEFSFQEAGGTVFVEIVFPNGACTAGYELEFMDTVDEWATFTYPTTNPNIIQVDVSVFESVNGSSSRATGSRVAINGTQIGILGVNQTGPPVFPTCDLTNLEVDGTSVPLGTDIDFGVNGDTKNIKVVFDPVGCAGEITFKDYNNPNGIPEWDDWLSFAPLGNSTFSFTTIDNINGQTKIAYVGIYNLQNEFLGLFRISQISCMEKEWYPDQDGDGGGDAFAEPRYGCDPPTDQSYAYIDNYWDLCPDDPGSEANQGCPENPSPENRNTITTLSYDLNEQLKVGSKSYFDEIGKLEQTQAWDIKSDSIWASATRYDEYGRPTLQTLSAPVSEGSNFLFKQGFIKKADNSTDYGLADYDGANIEEPLPVGDTAETLGWYYSENNDRENLQDVTDHPFTKSVYSDLNPGKVLRAVGGNKINGEWPQAYTFSMKASHELSQGNAFGETGYNDIEITKTVTRDVHGVENVIFTDSDGKLLAAARSGGQNISGLLPLVIPEQGFIDVHVPEGITNGFSINDPNRTTVYDLLTEQITTVPEKNLPPGFYRVVVSDLENYDPQFSPVLVQYRVNYYDYSLNEYDEADRLIASYQPLGATKAEKPVTTYSYNTLGQLLTTTSPDEGTAEFKYRDDGQIRFSQNSKQKDPNEDGDFSDAEFSYTNYDTYGRPVESGVYKEGTVTFANADNLLENILEDIEVDNDGLTDANCTEQTFTLYDKADTANLHSALTVEGIPTAEYPTQKFVNGNVSKTYTVEPGSSTTTWYSYDIYGRVAFMVQQIEGLGTKTIDYEYDPVTGQVTKVYYQKHRPSERFIHRYGYNEGDQLITVETSTDDSNFTLHANYTYYETGALKRTALAPDAQGNPAQGIDYVYNLAGQLKSINHPSLDGANDPQGDTDDLFGMQLDYHADDYKRNVPGIAPQTYGTDQLNGNIKGVRWMNKAVPGMTNELMYTYQYDRNNWLQSADFDGDGDLGDGTEETIISSAVVESGENLDLEATQSITLVPDPNGGEGFHAKDGSDFSAKIVTGSGGTTIMAGDYDVSNLTYDANGNILTLKRNKGSDGAGNAMDDLGYSYKPGTNQLQQVVDAVVDAPNADDINTQPDPENYVYNKIGQLVENKAENLTYEYNASGLVTAIKRNNLNLVMFFYNDRNHRVRKDTYDPMGMAVVKTTNYVRDAAGSVMAIYTDNVLDEQSVYGKSRLGVYYRQGDITLYELTDHLGNVRATIAKAGNNPDVRGGSDYFPFGMTMPGRALNGAEGYRYAYQGQEEDSETNKEAFELRLWDNRIGRWLVPDLYGEFISPYLGMGNNPIGKIDPNGGTTTCPDCPEGGNKSGIFDSNDGYSYEFKDNIWNRIDGGVLNEVVVRPGLNLDEQGFSTNKNIVVDKIPGLEKGRPDMGLVQAIILHRTVSRNYPGEWMKSKDKVKGAHFYIDTDGTIYQTASLDVSVAHIYSNPKQMYAEYYKKLVNSNTVGIEVVGYYENEKWDPLTSEQIDATSNLVKTLQNHYNIHQNKVYPHEKVQRKTAGEGQTVLDAINNN